MVTFKHPMVEGVFIERVNRFAALVEVKNKRERVFVPNSGRMKELLIPGAQVWLTHNPGEHRVTSYDLVLVSTGTTLVSVDSRMANNLLNSWLKESLLPEFFDYDNIKREVKFGSSRIDFFLRGAGQGAFVEAKSVTLVDGEGTARFPDAPTIRGTRHLEELMKVVGEGLRGVVFFVIQRDDAKVFCPNDATDLAFGRALRIAVEAGVEAYAASCRVSDQGISLYKRIPVIV